MDYVDWVEKVMDAAARAWRQANPSARFVGVGLPEITEALGFSVDAMADDFAQSKLAEALRDALRDLHRMGLLGTEDHRRYTLTGEGNKYPVATLPTAWPRIMEQYLDDEQRIFLDKVAQIGQDVYDEYVCVKNLTGEHIFDALGWPWDHEGSTKGYLLARQLSEMGMLVQRPFMGGHIELVPTYVGIVRVARQVEAELGKLVRELREEWETTSVEFKRELHLERDREKAEFVRDTLGLATTKSSGRRFLIIGFDDKSRDFAVSVDPKISQERIEQILHAYCEPVPTLRYQRVPWSGGEAGVIELFRTPEHIPYRVKKDLGGGNGIRRGEIFVRHGSHTEAPTPRESQDLLDEGDRARGSA